MDSTLENCNRSREVRDSVILGLSGFASALARRASYRHGVEFDDMRQHILMDSISQWPTICHWENLEAITTHVMKNSARDYLTIWYGKGRTAERNSDDVYEKTDIVHDVAVSDPMFMSNVYREISSLPSKKMEVVSSHFFDDVSIYEMDGVSKTTADTYINDFLVKLRDKFGVKEDVKRRVPVRTETYTLTHPQLGSESGTISDLAKRLKLDNGGVHRVCRGKKKSVKGWRLI